MSNVDASSNGVMRSLSANFLGSAPVWYKFTTLLFLVINPLIFFSASIFGGSAEQSTGLTSRPDGRSS